MTLACFNLDGKTPLVIESFIILYRGFDIILLAHLNIRIGRENNPYALLFGVEKISDSTSEGVTGWKAKDPEVLGLLPW